MDTPMLSIRDLAKRFGALTATDNLSLDVARGEMHALIGPNGAGKTTLIGQITGELVPNEGTIHFDGNDITGLSVDARARLGLARSFQISSVFDTFTAQGNVALSAQARQPHSFRFWTPARSIAALRGSARDKLSAVGLSGRDATVAADLAHGEHRQLELAMALATEPKMLLLDEPMAGLGAHESRAMTELLRRLKSHYTILLVEHDMDVVFSLADRISVLVGGRLIASGTPDDIRNNADVRYAYLGEDSEDLLEGEAAGAAH
jgi:branched-chain amino acid transport system ATP-binding protein